MHTPFQIARAFDHHGTLVKGFLYIDNDALIDKTNDKVHIIKPDQHLSFNTGLTDQNGNEIFTGDFLSHSESSDTKFSVEFVTDEGAFFLKRHSVLKERGDDAFKISNVDEFFRLHQAWANELIIVGNIYEDNRDDA